VPKKQFTISFWLACNISLGHIYGFDIIHSMHYTYNYIHQHMHTRWYNSCTSLKDLLHVLPRHHPQAVSNTKEYKHLYISLGSTMPNIKIFKYTTIMKYIKWLSTTLQCYSQYVYRNSDFPGSFVFETRRGWHLRTETYKIVK